MNIFTRLSDLITVNFHALLDRAENPERMLAHLVRTMEEGLDATRRQAAGAIAAERGLGRELDQQRAAALGWTRRARLAMKLGREDLARRALAHKIEHDDIVVALDVQHAAALRLGSDVKSALHTLRLRVAEARRRQQLLQARQQAAHVRLEVQRALGEELGDLGNVEAPGASFEQLARRLLAFEDQVFAQTELSQGDSEINAELDRLEITRRIEEEIESLKRENPTPDR